MTRLGGAAALLDPSGQSAAGHQIHLGLYQIQRGLLTKEVGLVRLCRPCQFGLREWIQTVSKVQAQEAAQVQDTKKLGESLQTLCSGPS